ncbi:MAG: mechanosensitive ion channel family protein, partial [Hyphomicrobiales bacterium]
MNYLVVLQDQLQGMARQAIALLPSLAIATVVLLIAWLVARFATGIVHRITGRTRLRGDLKDLLETLVRVAIW